MPIQLYIIYANHSNANATKTHIILINFLKAGFVDEPLN